MKQSNQVMIVEDDQKLNQGLCRALKGENPLVSCPNLHSAFEQLSIGTPALILLDVKLPDGNGLNLLKAVKATTPQVRVILLTANDSDADIVEGLNLGADDYICKPFSLAVLRARVQNQLRQISLKAEDDCLQIDQFSFDFSRMTFSLAGKPIELSKTEQKLLRLLVKNTGCTLSRTQLIDYIWSTEQDFVDENTLSVTVKRLRDKLGAQAYIKTVYGLGYCWVKDHD